MKLAWYLPICFRLWGKQVSFYIKSIKISISSDKSPLCQQPDIGPKLLPVFFRVLRGSGAAGVVLCRTFRAIFQLFGNGFFINPVLHSAGLALHNFPEAFRKLFMGDKLLFAENANIRIPPCKPLYIEYAFWYYVKKKYNLKVEIFFINI